MSDKTCTVSLLTVLLAVASCSQVSSAAQTTSQPVAQQSLAKMPVKEVTIFKDGHAFVLQEGDMTTDPSGNVVLSDLPCPVIGTFWPYSADAKAKLTGVVAGKTRTTRDEVALTLAEILAANVGATGLVTEQDNRSYTATILDIPKQPLPEPGESTSSADSSSRREGGKLILLQTQEGVKALPIERIRDFAFKDPPKRAVGQEEYRNLLTLKLDWGGKAPAGSARVGLVYLQKGLRWIPSYKVTIDGKGQAVIKLQATLINELTDLDDATTNLVIGVPTFAFKDTVDPISLQQAAAQLSQYFRESSQTAFAFSNAIMSQSAVPANRESPPARALDLGPEAPEAARNEDLYVFTIEHVSLKKGQRMAVPITEFSLAYKDVYTLNLPFSPPPEVRRHFDSSRQSDLAKLMTAPKVMHVLRLTNSGKSPLTTAPALILQGNRVLAQGMMTYTPPGGAGDLTVTAAVDIQVRKSDVEAGRVPNAVQWQGDSYSKNSLTGTITLTNHRGHPVEIEVTRQVFGNVDKADHDGKVEMVDVAQEGWTTEDWPYWWSWYSWPYWWYHFNGIGRIKWDVKLDAGKSIDLKYEWNYYWR
jgi:hypothetical protein